MSKWLAADTAGQFLPKDNFSAFKRTPKRLPDFTKFLTDLCEWVEWENIADETRRHRKWVKSIMYYTGRQLGRIGRDGNWRDITPLPTDPYFVDNKFRFYAKSVRKEWVRSNAEILTTGRNNTMEADGAARAAKAIIRAELDRIWTPLEKQREATFAILTGNYFRYTYFNTNTGPILNIPQFEDTQVMVGHDSVGCYDCGTETPADPNQPMQPQDLLCPTCGSQNVEAVNGQPATVPQQTGTTQQYAGQVVTEVVDPVEMKMHLHSRTMPESPYLRRKRFVLKQIIEATYPWVQFSEGGHRSQCLGLWYQNELERSPGNVSGTGRTSFGEGTADRYSNMVELCQYWFEPVLYTNYTLEKDLELATGEVVPAGVNLTELFPDGMYMARVGSAFVDIRNEKRTDHWLHGTYDPVPTNIWGDGNEDAVEQQRQHNEVSSLIVTNIMNCDAPSTIYNPLKISRSQFSGKPHEMVPLKNATLADEPAKYVYTPSPRPVGAEPINYRQMLEQSMQTAFAAFNAANGQTDSDNKTATGISILRDQAVSLLGAPLEIKGYTDMLHSQQVIRLVHANWHPEVYLPLLGDHGQAEGEWFAACDPDRDIEIKVRPGSHMPRDEAQSRNDIIEALTLGAIPGGGVYSPMFPPDARPEAMKRLNLPFDSDKQQVDTRRQFIEIQKIKVAIQAAMEYNQSLPPESHMLGQMAQMGAADLAASQEQAQQGQAGQGGPEDQGGEQGAPPQQDPMQQATGMVEQATGMPLPKDPIQFALAQVPVEPLVDEHPYHIEELKRYLKTDKADQDPPEVRQALLMHLEQHMQAMQMMMGIQMMMQGGAPGGDPNGGGNPQGGPPQQGASKDKAAPTGSDTGNGKPKQPPRPKTGEQGK